MVYKYLLCLKIDIITEEVDEDKSIVLRSRVCVRIYTYIHIYICVCVCVFFLIIYDGL